MVEMAETMNFEDINNNFGEIKGLIADVKDNMMNGEDCNNQFYTVIQTLDNISTSVDNIAENKSAPSDEYTILQTNILEVRNEVSRLNTNIDETICQDLKELLSKLSEKVNRLEILTNNAGIDQQVVMNATGSIEKSISVQLKESADILYSQNSLTVENVRKDIGEINNNLRECVEYLEDKYKTTSETAVRTLTDDLTVLGTTIEKNTDNLKRSMIDIFSRIQEIVERGITSKSLASYEPSKSNSGLSSEDVEMLKNGIYNLDVNSEQRILNIARLISETELYTKLEKFAQMANLPAVGDLKLTLKSNIERIANQYSMTLQTSQNREDLNVATDRLKEDLCNEIISMLNNVSEFILGDEDQSGMSSIQMDAITDKLDELTSVTELNNSGYGNIQIELNDLRERSNAILETLEKRNKKGSLEESVLEIKNDITEIQAKTESIKKQGAEIGDVIRECTSSIIEAHEPASEKINEMLLDIKKNISILQSGDEESDYTYSMQDIESDVAKIRIYLNELSQNGISVNSEEFTDELNSIVVMVDSMKQQLNKIDECNLAETIEKLGEDVTSISTRVNKLLLTSDNANSMIENSLKEFKVLSENIDEQIQQMSKSNKFKTIEDSLVEVKSALAESNSYSSLINQSLIMLAEWVDNAGEAITNISEKLEKLDDLNNVQMAISNISIPETVDYSETFRVLEDKILEQNARIESQEEHLNKLDEKLSMILELVAKNDSSNVSAKMNDIDEKMEKLNKSIERLTSYVNEE